MNINVHYLGQVQQSLVVFYDKGGVTLRQVSKLQVGFYTVPLAGMDIVLGAEWLMLLGTFTTNLQKQFMKIMCQGKVNKLQKMDSKGIYGQYLGKEDSPQSNTDISNERDNLDGSHKFRHIFKGKLEKGQDNYQATL